MPVQWGIVFSVLQIVLQAANIGSDWILHWRVEYIRRRGQLGDLEAQHAAVREERESAEAAATAGSEEEMSQVPTVDVQEPEVNNCVASKEYLSSSIDHAVTPQQSADVEIDDDIAELFSNLIVPSGPVAHDAPSQEDPVPGPQVELPEIDERPEDKRPEDKHPILLPN